MLASDAQSVHSVMAQGIAECQKELKPMQAQIHAQSLANRPGLYGETSRMFDAARSAEDAGNELDAFRLCQAIDANADAIKTEAQSNPAHAGEMLGILGLAQTKIGVSYERRGHDAEAAVYYQKAIDTMAHNGSQSAYARTRLGFLYANGRGVPRDRDRALALFGGASGEILGSRGSAETGFAYLLAHDKLPYRIEDMTPGLVASVEGKEVERQTQMLAAALATAPPNQRQETPSSGSSNNKCSILDYYYAPREMGGMLAGIYLGGGCK
jgi:hypothetical protein